MEFKKMMNKARASYRSKTPDRHSHGLTEVHMNGKYLTVSHCGNMGNTIKGSVNPNLKKLGYAAIENLKELGEFAEYGSPDYSYTLVVKVG